MSDSNDELKWYEALFAGLLIIFAAGVMVITAVILVLLQPKLWWEALRNKEGK